MKNKIIIVALSITVFIAGISNSTKAYNFDSSHFTINPFSQNKIKNS